MPLLLMALWPNSIGFGPLVEAPGSWWKLLDLVHDVQCCCTCDVTGEHNEVASSVAAGCVHLLVVSTPSTGAR